MKLKKGLGDADIRPSLRTLLLSKHARNPETVLLEELGMCRGRVRIDLAVVNGNLHGYEIKSDRDSLRRLGRQINIYSKVLDRATLVAGEQHLSKSLELLPSWWGVLRIDTKFPKPRFKSVRRGRPNPARDPRSIVELLWLEDALGLLDQRNAARGVRGKPRCVVWDRVCEVFNVNEIAAAVRINLKARATPPVAPPPL